MPALHVCPAKVGAPLQTLYLSKNSLRSLQGMQQFSSLVTLTAADNLIGSFEELHYLTAANHARQLQALSLEGNPVARLPHYRCPVSSGCFKPAKVQSCIAMVLQHNLAQLPVCPTCAQPCGGLCSRGRQGLVICKHN